MHIHYPKIFTSIFALQALACFQFVQANEDAVFVETNGILIVEIESATAATGWDVRNLIPEFTGDSYYQWTGPNRYAAHLADEGAMTYRFEITNPGNYEFRWRSYIAEGDENTEHNDSWIQFPTGTNITGEEPLSGWTKAYQNRLGEWTWATSTVDFSPVSLRQYFDVGEHTIEIAGRSTGHALDRFTLFKYDDITFRIGPFTNAAISPLKSDIEEVEPPTGPNEEVPTDPVVDWSTTDTQAEANVCAAGLISVNSVSSLYKDNAEVEVSGDLLIDDNQRISYLKFDLRYIPADAESAVLELPIVVGGAGTLVVSTGSHSDWTETDLATLPDVTLVLDNFPGNWISESIVALPVDSQLLGNEYLTLILNMESGGDSLTIGANGGSNEPRLVLSSSNESFCTSYDQLQPAVETEENPFVDTEENPTFVNEVINPPSTPENGPEDLTDENPVEVDASEEQSNSAGSISFTLLGFIVLVLTRVFRSSSRCKRTDCAAVTHSGTQ